MWLVLRISHPRKTPTNHNMTVYLSTNQKVIIFNPRGDGQDCWSGQRESNARGGRVQWKTLRCFSPVVSCLKHLQFTRHFTERRVNILELWYHLTRANSHAVFIFLLCLHCFFFCVLFYLFLVLRFLKYFVFPSTSPVYVAKCGKIFWRRHCRSYHFRFYWQLLEGACKHTQITNALF